MRARLFAAAAACALASPALALQEPRAVANGDPRMREIDANERDVTRLVVPQRSTVKIILPAGERSLGASSGDTTQWEVMPAADKDEDAANILIVKAKVKEVRPGAVPITVVSRTPDGESRVREFEVVQREAGIELTPNLRQLVDEAVRNRAVVDPAKNVMLSVTIVDRARAAKEAAERRRQRERDADTETVRHRQSVAFYEGPRNWEYEGTSSIWQDVMEVSDNGQQTFFRFPGNTPRPVIFMVMDKPGTEPCSSRNPDDEERAQRIPHGELVVIGTTWSCFRLRFGTQHVMDVRNNAYSPLGVNYGTGTNTPDVVRQPREVPRPRLRTAGR